MNKLKFNPDNAKYYSEEFIKGFECGVERQFNEDNKTGKWIKVAGVKNNFSYKCSTCDKNIGYIYYKHCPECGIRNEVEDD